MKYVNLFINEVELKDSWFYLGLPFQSQEYSFFNFPKSEQQSYTFKDMTSNLFILHMTLRDEKKEYERQVYGILDALGDYGGLVEVGFYMMLFFYKPIAKHIFLTKAIKNLYVAETSNEELFEKRTSKRAQRIEHKLAKLKG